MTLKSIDEITECQFCGSKGGFWVMAAASGLTQTQYSFDGSTCDNSGMYNLVREKNRKYAQCNSCHKSIGLVTDDAIQNVVERTHEENSSFY